MRRSWLIAASALAVFVLIIAGLLIYGALNLNSLVKNNRQYLLDRVGDALKRKVQAQNVRATLGWGVALEITGLQVADDPSFSQLPFFTAKRVSAEVELLPLLSREVLITRLEMLNPEMRVVRDKMGRLNLATLGARRPGPSLQPGPGKPQGGGGAPQVPIHLLVRSLSTRDGEIIYQEADGENVAAGHLNLDIRGVNLSRPFPVRLGLSLLGEGRNLSVAGTVGPLMSGGAIQVMDVPFSFNITAGPVLLDRLRNVPEFRRMIPGKLSMPDPFTVKSKVKGTLRAAGFDVKTDLGGARLVYVGMFNKPGGTPFQISASGFCRDDKLGVSRATVKLAGLQAHLSQLDFSGGSWSGKIDTNRFDLAPITKMAARLAKYELSGSSEAHLLLSSSPVSRAKGTVALDGVAFRVEENSRPAITALTGTIVVDGGSAVLEPTNFKLGAAQAVLQAKATSLRPLRASYSFSADSFKLAELMPERPPDEQVSQLKATGTLDAKTDGAVTLTIELSSGEGMVSKVRYRNLALKADYDGRQVNVSSLTLDTYGGSVGASAADLLARPRPFHATVNLNHIDLQQALSAQKAKAANTLSGLLTGQINASGRGTYIEEIKPTLAGNGRVQIEHGKLIGVNVVGTALKKINSAPAVGTLLTPAMMERHPALFNSSDTDLNLVRLSYVMTGPRMTSHDIMVQADDYNVTGEGWFDMDRNVDLSLRLLMSKQFSSELQAQKKNVAYLEDPDGQIEIPLSIRGTLPHPTIQPDIGFLVQRAAIRAIQEHGSDLFRHYLSDQGFGKVMHGGGGGTSSGKPPANPLSPLENLLH
jgi:uncharacterized protein involved in outer membrane biogenesis